MNFSIAGFYEKKDIMNKLLFLYKNNNNYFHSDIAITNIFDSFPSLCWNGGRLVSDLPFDRNDASNMIDEYGSLGIGLRVVFSNLIISKLDLNDSDCNFILEKISCSRLNSVTVSSLVLYNHIKNNYPNLKIVISLTHFYGEYYSDSEIVDFISEKENSIVVLPPEKNNKNFLSRLSSKKNVEIIINETCHSNCEFKQLHYQMISENNRGRSIKKLNNFCNSIHKDKKNNYEYILDRKDIVNLSNKFKINNFKLSGRSLSNSVYTLFLLKYLIKDSYGSLFIDYIADNEKNNLFEIKKQFDNDYKNMNMVW